MSWWRILILCLTLTLLPQAVLGQDQMVAVTQLASGKERMRLFGIKNLSVGVHPLPPELKTKAFSELSLANIINDRVETLDLDNNPKTATHLLSLQLNAQEKGLYSLILTVVQLKPVTHALPLWTLKMKARITKGSDPAPRIMELVKRGTLIFCRNYQIANGQLAERNSKVPPAGFSVHQIPLPNTEFKIIDGPFLHLKDKQ